MKLKKEIVENAKEEVKQLIYVYNEHPCPHTAVLLDRDIECIEILLKYIEELEEE